MTNFNGSTENVKTFTFGSVKITPSCFRGGEDPSDPEIVEIVKFEKWSNKKLTTIYMSWGTLELVLEGFIDLQEHGLNDSGSEIVAERFRLLDWIEADDNNEISKEGKFYTKKEKADKPKKNAKKKASAFDRA